MYTSFILPPSSFIIHPSPFILLHPSSFLLSFLHRCKTVLHTASPFYFQGGSEESLVTPAVEGTTEVLSACTRLGVEQVVLTASTACVYGKIDEGRGVCV